VSPVIEAEFVVRLKAESRRDRVDHIGEIRLFQVLVVLFDPGGRDSLRARTTASRWCAGTRSSCRALALDQRAAAMKIGRLRNSPNSFNSPSLISTVTDIAEKNRRCASGYLPHRYSTAHLPCLGNDGLLALGVGRIPCNLLRCGAIQPCFNGVFPAFCENPPANPQICREETGSPLNCVHRHIAMKSLSFLHFSKRT
jgi:hypothetical protein